jgi:hypothetical protein
MKSHPKFSAVFTLCFLLTPLSLKGQTVKVSSLKGVWERVGYSELIEIGDDEARFYDLTTISLILREAMPIDAFDQLMGEVKADIHAREIVALPSGMITSYKLKKLSGLPKRYISGKAGDVKDPVINFDVLWHIFHENYVFFELRKIDWYEQYRHFRPKVFEDMPEKKFFRVCESLIQSLGDGHVSLRTPYSKGFLEDTEELEKFYKEFKTQDKYDNFMEYLLVEVLGNYRKMVAKKYLQGKVKTFANDKLIWGMMKDNIGYIEIAGMAGYSGAFDLSKLAIEVQVAGEGIDKILKDLKHANAIIIDIRTNGGGLDSISMEIANRFADQKRLAFTKKARLGDGFTETLNLEVCPEGEFQYTGPVVLLTGPLSMSAAEIFTMCMMALPHVTTMGGSTKGILSDVLGKTLPNGWRLGLSNEVYLASDGKLYENIGIPPKVKIPINMFDVYVMNHDPILDRAVEFLRSEK